MNEYVHVTLKKAFPHDVGFKSRIMLLSHFERNRTLQSNLHHLTVYDLKYHYKGCTRTLISKIKRI